MKFSKIIFQMLLLLLIQVGQTTVTEPCFKKIEENRCDTSEKMECNGPLGSCKCEDKSMCIWTNMQSVSGCPCKTTKQNDYSFLQQAIANGCNDDKFECRGSFCNCKCLDGSTCIFSGDKPVMGCPCNVKKIWEETKPLNKDEKNKRRQEREQKRKEKENQEKKEEGQGKKNKQKVVIEDI